MNKIREYTERERSAMLGCLSLLRAAGLTPFDMIGGVYLYEIHSALKEFGGVDFLVHEGCVDEVKQALARKAGIVNRGILESELP